MAKTTDKIEYTNVDWDYPSCGGVEVTRGNKGWIITNLSNMTGQHTETKHHVDFDKADTAEAAAEAYYRGEANYVEGSGFLVR